MEHLLTDPIEVLEFIIAGNSTVTFKSKETGCHFTYKVKKAKDKQLHFVSVLYGDNTSDYQYIGCIFDDTGLKHTKGSKCKPDAKSFIVFRWVWEHIKRLNPPPETEIWHEGSCGRCGRKLTEPESIACGLGPICREK